MINYKSEMCYNGGGEVSFITVLRRLVRGLRHAHKCFDCLFPTRRTVFYQKIREINRNVGIGVRITAARCKHKIVKCTISRKKCCCRFYDSEKDRPLNAPNTPFCDRCGPSICQASCETSCNHANCPRIEKNVI